MYLRLPYRIIRSNLSELFNENISPATISNVLKYFSKYYKYTENKNLSLILESPFIHADETKVNVLGKENYVWVFTNGKQIYFRLSETRENKIAKKILGDYKGILISDFYPGYDSIKCKQQKCWVHLIRDINDDLWKNPFDYEFECFVDNLKQIIIPVFETIERFGSKKRYLKKHLKQIERFYATSIDNCFYNSILAQNYQKRFKKNKEKLFVFLEHDNIPWNNNMAERALRHIAVQRKISTFFAEGVHDYLRMLGIMQTCRFNNQSFLQFLISKRKTLN
jgi:transposase-like protein